MQETRRDPKLHLTPSFTQISCLSGDKDLLVLERFEGIAIVNATQALAMIEAVGP
jgi:hypothetical protein